MTLAMCDFMEPTNQTPVLTRVYHVERVSDPTDDEVARGGGCIFVEVHGVVHVDGVADPKRLVEETSYCFWWRTPRLEGGRSSLSLRSVTDYGIYRLGDGVLKPYQEQYRAGLSLAEAVARVAFGAVRKRVAPPKPVSLLGEFEREMATRKVRAREDADVVGAAWRELESGARHADGGGSPSCRYFSVTHMRDYLAQTGAAGRHLDGLSKADQSSVARSILERFVRDGKAARVIGAGRRGGDCYEYYALVGSESVK